MECEHIFTDALASLKAGGRYRTFVDLERRCGDFPRATWHMPDGQVEVTVWCSNRATSSGSISVSKCGRGCGIWIRP